MRRHVLLTVPLALAACAAPRDAATPAAPCYAPGFDPAGSDPQAIEIACEVQGELGGPEAWRQARVIEWTFFKPRHHCWDTWTDDYRLDEGGATVLMNLRSGDGRVYEGGSEVTDPERVVKALARAKSVWINDGYWLLMPWKLLDPGVHLGYAGERALPDGRKADVLVLTFDDVGDTPRNKYEVYVARDTHRVEEWSFWSDRDETEPRFTTPWREWRRYGPIWLSGDRGAGRTLTDIAVLDAPPAKLFAP